MRNVILTLAATLMVGSIGAFAAPKMAAASDEPAQEEATDSVVKYVFTDVKVLPKTTGVKDQNRSGTCWCFAGTSFIEDEILRQGGDSLHLSEMYSVYNCYKDKADRYIRMYGSSNFAPGGSVTDVVYAIKNYGAVPQEVYTGLQYGEDNHVHGELDAVLTAYLKAIQSRPNRKLSTAWKQGYKGILDAYLGELPQTFEYNGKTYTPQSFAQSLGLNLDDYIPVTSFTHHPFYTSFPLEVADNWTFDPYANVQLDELVAIVDNALENGYPVLWAADVSEPGFHWYDGFANMPVPIDTNSLEGTELSRWVHLSDKDREADRYKDKGPVKEMEITQEMRQDMFDRQETTDDHAMEIVGIAQDQTGAKFYKVKNSWDDNQVYDGYFYVSEPYFKAKTLSVLVNKDAIPAATAKKLGLKK